MTADMPRQDQVTWAKEMLLSAIDKMLSSVSEDNEYSLADEVELMKQRKRVAKFLNLEQQKK